MDYLFCSVAEEHLEAVSEVCRRSGSEGGSWVSWARSPVKHHCTEVGFLAKGPSATAVASSSFSFSEQSKDESQRPDFYCGARAPCLRLISDQHRWESIAAPCPFNPVKRLIFSLECINSFVFTLLLRSPLFFMLRPVLKTLKRDRRIFRSIYHWPKWGSRRVPS